MEERRQHVRIATPVMVTFPNPVSMKTERSYTQDVSEAGIRFPTLVKFEIGQEFPVTMALPFQETELQAMGAVVWIREISRLGPPQYEVGLRFRWIEDPDRQRLTHHLSSVFYRRT